MTVLSACSSAMVRLVGRKAETIYSSTSQMEIELGELATDVAIDIMKGHDWRALTKFGTITGTGLVSTFPIPEDYDRMVQAQGVSNPGNWLWGYTPVADLGDWMHLISTGYKGLSPGGWIILDGQIQFSPAPSAGAQARFAYISKNIARTSAGPSRASFSDDTDVFALEPRLLTLGLIWRWKAQKGLEYAEDLTNYEKALSESTARDKGPQAIRKGWGQDHPGTHLAWPWELG